MSAGRCPVCHEPKEMKRHLVCPACWVKVPEADQREVYRLYEHARGSEAHRVKCLEVVRDLHRKTPRHQRKAAPMAQE
jgi:hydroxypyruvate isomerase